MKKIRNFIQYFVTVTTGILIIAAISYSVQPADPTADTLWQILLSSALCALATVLFFPSDTAGKVRIWAGIGLHFASLCVIMVCCGRWFGWIGPSIPEAGAMMGYVVLVYAFVVGITYFLEKKQADTMTRKLKEKYAQDGPKK